MAIERKWALVPPQTILANGTSDGQLTVPDASLFKVKQKVILFSDTVSPIEYEVKRVPSATILLIGFSKDPIHKYANLSAFTTADNAKISSPEQDRPAIIPDSYERAVYEEEPVVAKRAVLVDKLGRKIDTVVGDDGEIRLAVDADVSVTGISVDLDAVTPPTRSDPDNALIAGSEDGLKTGYKRVFVNNLFNQILATEDRDQTITYDDPGTKNQRPSQIEYTSSHFPGVIARKTITYDDPGTKNQRPATVTRSIV